LDINKEEEAEEEEEEEEEEGKTQSIMLHSIEIRFDRKIASSHLLINHPFQSHQNDHHYHVYSLHHHHHYHYYHSHYLVFVIVVLPFVQLFDVIDYDQKYVQIIMNSPHYQYVNQMHEFLLLIVVMLL
jgi:hypothetical protein